jgi:hypothetical protein
MSITFLEKGNSAEKSIIISDLPTAGDKSVTSVATNVLEQDTVALSF